MAAMRHQKSGRRHAAPTKQDMRFPGELPSSRQSRPSGRRLLDVSRGVIVLLAGQSELKDRAVRVVRDRPNAAAV